MKTIKNFFACAVLVALASCSNDSDSTLENKAIRLYSSFGNVTTRAAVPGENETDDTKKLQDTQFANGQTVNVYITENTTGTATYTYGDGTGKLAYSTDGNGGLSLASSTPPQSTPYFPANGNGIDVFALYPIEKSATEFSIQTDQTTVDNYRKSDLMSGVPGKQNINRDKTDIKLNFSHKLSKIVVKLNLASGINDSKTSLEGATIKLTNVVKKGTFGNIDKNGIGTITASTNEEDKEREITIGKYDANGTAAIIIPQVINSEMEFKVALTNGGNYTVKVPKPESVSSFEEAKVYTYTLTLKAYNIEVSTSIKDWVSGGTGNGEAELDVPSGN